MHVPDEICPASNRYSIGRLLQSLDESRNYYHQAFTKLPYKSLTYANLWKNCDVWFVFIKIFFNPKFSPIGARAKLKYGNHAIMTRVSTPVEMVIPF